MPRYLSLYLNANKTIIQKLSVFYSLLTFLLLDDCHNSDISLQPKLL